ncbi:MAG: hypothetical protein IJX03_06170 [Clostridia bacterium]|nr:hypothetical protein [Clostridia bacterium]
MGKLMFNLLLSQPNVGILTALIGVAGTLMGTIIGWLLGKIDFGKLLLRIKEPKEKENWHSDYGDKEEKLNNISFSFTINLYNSSNNNRVFRNAKIILNDGKNDLLTLPLKDLDNVKTSNYFCIIGDINMINISPKTGIDLNAKFYVKDFNELKTSKKVYLIYENEKFKKKRCFLWDWDYASLVLTRQRKKSNTNLKEE